ncbi:MAG TPA: Flp family type IVb pilin [Tepidisphaeraceae bacterium]|jgi:pilus assembly protein Flp/PilA
MLNFRKLFKNKKGATAIEYGLIAALISIGAIAALTTVGTEVTESFTDTGTALVTANGT